MTREQLLAPILAASPHWVAGELDCWELIPFMVNGNHVGTAILKGAEIHFAAIKGAVPSGSLRRCIQKFIEPILDRYGFLTTRVLKTRTEQDAFVRRLGFMPTWNNDITQFYMLGVLPFQRNKT
jgi:hypothetical protein